MIVVINFALLDFRYIGSYSNQRTFSKYSRQPIGNLRFLVKLLGTYFSDKYNINLLTFLIFNSDNGSRITWFTWSSCSNCFDTELIHISFVKIIKTYVVTADRFTVWCRYLPIWRVFFALFNNISSNSSTTIVVWPWPW